MKTLQVFILSFVFILFSTVVMAQGKTEKFKVAGACGMCKSKIEKAAKSAGASYALWNPESKQLTVKYSSKASNTAKIQQAIAGTGYDTPGFKATDAAYSKLDECCQYERSNAAASCCTDDACAQHHCFKDGKCEKDQDCCKNSSGCSEKSCCAKS